MAISVRLNQVSHRIWKYFNTNHGLQTGIWKYPLISVVVWGQIVDISAEDVEFPGPLTDISAKFFNVLLMDEFAYVHHKYHK